MMKFTGHSLRKKKHASHLKIFSLLCSTMCLLSSVYVLKRRLQLLHGKLRFTSFRPPVRHFYIEKLYRVQKKNKNKKNNSPVSYV